MKYNETMLIFIMLLVTALGQTAVDIYLPSMPGMQAALMTTKSAIQLTLSLYTIGFGVSQLFYGPLSDRFGRRPILITGLSIYFLASIGCVFVNSVDALMAFRLLQGLGIGVAAVVIRAILRDSFTGTKMSQVATYLSLAWSLVPITAPVLGSYFQKYINWRANFVFLMLYGAISLLLVIKWLPNTNSDKRITSLHPVKLIQNYWHVISNFSFIRYSTGPLIAFASVISFVTVSPFLLQTDLGFTPVQFGWISLLVSSAYLVANIINIRLLPHYGRIKMLRFGVFCSSVGSISMLVLALLGYFNLAVIIVPACLIIFSGGFIFANCISGALIPFSQIAGTAAALLGCIQMLGASAASGIMSLLPTRSQLPLSVLLVIFSCILAIALLPLSEEQQA